MVNVQSQRYERGFCEADAWNTGEELVREVFCRCLSSVWSRSGDRSHCLGFDIMSAIRGRGLPTVEEHEEEIEYGYIR